MRYCFHHRFLYVCKQDYANTTGWNFMKKIAEEGSWSNLDPIKFWEWSGHCLDKNNLDFLIYSVLCSWRRYILSECSCFNLNMSSSWLHTDTCLWVVLKTKNIFVLSKFKWGSSFNHHSSVKTKPYVEPTFYSILFCTFIALNLC